MNIVDSSKKTLRKLAIALMASRPVSVVADRIYGSGVPIFMLHRISSEKQPQNGEISTHHIEQAITFLKSEGYSFISLNKLVSAISNGHELPRKSVCFTIDDGYEDQAQLAAPLFLAHECPLTFFVITGMLNQQIWPWDAKVSWIISQTKQSKFDLTIAGEKHHFHFRNDHQRRLTRRNIQNLLKTVPSNDVQHYIDTLCQAADVSLPDLIPDYFRAMTWDSARKLEREGIDFAPHSQSHQILSQLPAEESENEILSSWNTISEQLERPVKIFCYPTGREKDFSDREIATLKNHDFLAAVSTNPAPLRETKYTGTNKYKLPRIAFPNTMEDLIKCCSWIELARSK